MIKLTDEQRKISAKYTALISRHGRSHKSLDWGSQASQIKRFDVLAGIGDLAGKSVLDIGCGLCDFYVYLRERGIEIDYHGIDITSKMIETSKERFPDLDLEVRDMLVSPVTKTYDYVFSSGIFYLLSTEDIVWRMIENMYNAAGEGVAFNSLSAWADEPEDGELSLDPCRVIENCRRHTRRVVMRHDYMPHDFSIYMYRNSE